MNNKIISTLVSIAALTAVTNAAWAVGTASGTSIKNTASIDYSVGGTAQTSIASSPTGNSTPGTAGTPTTFVVDKKIDLTVTEGVDVNVVPGATAQDITYTLKNTGNSTEYFKLLETQVGSDHFDTTNCSITTAPEVITASDTVQLAADATTTITVACDIPASSGTVTNGATSNLDLKATAVTDSAGATAYTESATDTTGVDIVLADANATATDADATDGGARNASHSAVNTYTINSADLTVQKTSAIINDPENGTTNPKRIPGATIEYTITVTNADGVADATHITISDVLPGNLTYVNCTPPAAPAIVNATAPDAGVALACSESGGTVSSTSFTLPGGTGSANSTTLKFTATVD